MPESKRPLKVFPSAAQGKPLPYHPLVGRLRGQAEGAGVVSHAETTRRATVAGRGGSDPWAELGGGFLQGCPRHG